MDQFLVHFSFDSVNKYQKISLNIISLIISNKLKSFMESAPGY